MNLFSGISWGIFLVVLLSVLIIFNVLVFLYFRITEKKSLQPTEPVSVPQEDEINEPLNYNIEGYEGNSDFIDEQPEPTDSMYPEEQPEPLVKQPQTEFEQHIVDFENPLMKPDKTEGESVIENIEQENNEQLQSAVDEQLSEINLIPDDESESEDFYEEPNFNTGVAKTYFDDSTIDWKGKTDDIFLNLFNDINEAKLLVHNEASGFIKNLTKDDDKYETET